LVELAEHFVENIKENISKKLLSIADSVCRDKKYAAVMI